MANNPGGEYQFNKATGQQEWVPYFENRANPSYSYGGSYTVQQGDSYEAIARKLFGNERMFAELMKMNGGVYLHPGMQLDVPQNIQTPFVSNELAAALGMATSGQIATAYNPQTADLYNGKMNWTQQAQTNQQWAYDAARGNAQPLQYGNLPTGYAPSTTSGVLGANPVTPQNQTVAPRGHNGTDIAVRNAKQSVPLTTSYAGASTQPVTVPNFMAMPITPAQSAAMAALPRSPSIVPHQWSGVQPGQSTIGTLYNNFIGSITNSLSGQPANGATPVGTGLAFWGEVFKPVFGSSPTTPNIAPRSNVTEGSITQPTADTTTSATQLVAQNVSTADIAATQTGWDWMSIRAGLAVQPPSWYPSQNYSYYSGGGGGGGGSMSNGYYGLVNLRLSSG